MTGPCGVLNSGDLATWLTAIGTIGAVIVAVLVYRGSVSDKRRAQATKVSCHLKSHNIHPKGERIEGEALVFDGQEHVVTEIPREAFVYPEKVMKLTVPFYNLSDEQLSDVRILVVDMAGRPVHDVGLLGAVPPRAEQQIVRNVPNYWRIPRQARAVVYFTDAAGRHWERHQDRPLKRRRKPPADPKLSGAKDIRGQIAEQQEHVGPATTDEAKA